MKLYRNQKRPDRWYAYSKLTGWVMFPAGANGWSKREPARGIDPIHIREVAAHLAADTGFPGAAEVVEAGELVEVG